MVIHAGMSAEHSLWNSAGPRAALDLGDRLRRHVALAEIPEGGERGARRLAGELQPSVVRGVDHPDDDVGDPDGAARCAGIEHGRGRHLGAEFEPARGFRAVDLDRLAIVPRDGLDHFNDVREDGAHEAVCPRADEDAAGKTLDFAPAGEARKRPVDGAARTVLQKALACEGLSLRQLAYAGSNGSCGGHGRTLCCPELYCFYGQPSRNGCCARGARRRRTSITGATSTDRISPSRFGRVLRTAG